MNAYVFLNDIAGDTAEVLVVAASIRHSGVGDDDDAHG